MLVGSGVRAMFGVFIKPIETDMGWSRQQLSGAAALSLFVLGAVGPMVGWLADVWGPRRVMLLSTAVLGAGALLTSLVGHLWQMYGSAGVLMAAGAGGLGMATSATIAARWLLASHFFVCRYLSNGLVLTHLVPHAAELGFSQLHASLSLGLIGAMNIVGTVASDRICDRFARKGPIPVYYGVRRLSLIFLLY